MSISSSTRDQETLAATAAQERGATVAPITLSERSSIGLAIVRICVGFLWFQQLFWKLPPTFAGLYVYVVRESQHVILPGYGALLQHTFLAGCSSPSSPIGCTAFVPLAACVWTAELLVAISLLFGLFTRFGAMLSTILSVQLYVGLAYTDWIWTYGMLVLLALIVVGGVFGLIFGALQRSTPVTAGRALLTGLALGVLWWLIFELVLTNILNHASSPFSLSFGRFLASFPLDALFGVLIGAIFIQWQAQQAAEAS